MACTGPCRNQYIGPVRPYIPLVTFYSVFEESQPPVKRCKLIEYYYQYKTLQKAQVKAIVDWEDSHEYAMRAKRLEIFKHCEVSRI